MVDNKLFSSASLSSKILTSKLFAELGLTHGFTTLKISPEEEQSLRAQTASVKQVHGDTVLFTETLERGQREADALGTLKSHLSVGIYTADCVPLLLCARTKNDILGVMAVHAGWKGSALQIAAKGLAALAQTTGASEVSAVIGPCISQASFEVGEEVVAAFPQVENTPVAKFLRQEESESGVRKKYLLDLEAINAQQLKATASALHVSLELEILGHCTVKRKEEYPSYRRDRERSTRMLSFVQMP